jgi:hypothetical protein
MAEPHGIRKHGSHRVFYVQSECSNCGRIETLACYEDSIGKRDFHHGFLECPNCFKIVCGDCKTESGKEYCPDCGDVKLRKLTPLEVYRCNICFLDQNVVLCNMCRYPHLKKRKKRD